MRKRNVRQKRRHNFVASSSSSAESESVSSEAELSYSDFEYTESDSPVASPNASESPRLPHQNRVIPLPEWEATPVESPILNDCPDFDIIQTHSRLEVIEGRITARKFTDFKHPAQVIEADDKFGKSLTTSAAEEEKQWHYHTALWQIEVPDFWVARKWDNMNKVMSAADSQALEEEIAEISKVEAPSGSSDRNHIRRRERRPKMILELSKLDFLTDHMDEQTDYEFDW